MNSNTIKTKTLGIFLSLALVLSLAAAVLPATPAQAAVTAVDITSPTAASPEYVQAGETVTAQYRISVDADGTARIRIEIGDGVNPPIATYEYTQFLDAAGSPHGLSADVTIPLDASDGSYNLLVSAEQPSGSGGWVTDTEPDAVVVDSTPPTIQTDTLTSPNGGECWRGGSVQTITWSSGDITDDNLGANPITIEYYDGDSWESEASGEANDGAYDWTVDSLDISNAKVRITATDLAGNTASDESDAPFIIDSTPPDITLVEYVPDPTNDNTPTYTGSAEDNLCNVVSIEYQVTGATTIGWTAISITPAQTVNFGFTSGTLNDGSNTFDIRAKDEAGNEATLSPADVLQVDTAVPTLTLDEYTPDPTSDTTPTYTGTATDVDSNIVEVKYRVDGGTWTDVDSFAPAGTVDYTFTTPALEDGEHTIEAKAKDAAGNWSDLDSDTLTIDSGIPSVTLSPYTPDPTNDDTPTYSGTATSSGSNIVEIQYRVDGGAWQNVLGFVPDTVVNFEFTTAALTDGSHSIEARAKNQAGTWSQPPYPLDTLTVDTQAPTLVELTSPDGGEVWNAGSAQAITWQAFDNLPGYDLTITLEYSTEGNGGPWKDIVDGLNKPQGTESYSWTVPDEHSSNCFVKLTVADAAGNSASDISDGAFTIQDTTAPTVTVDIPNGGESWAAGSARTITWTANDNVSDSNMTYELYYCTDYTGTTWNLIDILDNQPLGTRTYTWDPVPTPAGGATSNLCRVKVIAKDINDNVAEDISDGNFSIVVHDLPPEVTLTSPNGGESWQGGTCHKIEWTASDPADPNCPLTYVLKYSTDGGTTYPNTIVTLSNRDQGTQSFCWAVPDVAGIDYRVKVEATGPGGTASDASDSDFTVTAADAGLLTKTITLQTGWNLISLEVMPTCCPSTNPTCCASYPIESVLADVLDKVESVWYYDASTTSWQSYAPGAPSSLTTMTDGKAYWIKMAAGDSLTYQGRENPPPPASPPTYSYPAGWNMVGFKSTTAKPVQDYLGGTCGDDYAAPIYCWDAAAQDWCTKDCANDMNLGSGYWVYFYDDYMVFP